MKERYFKQVDAKTHEPNGNRKLIRPNAHDVVIHYELAPKEALNIVVGGKVLWSTANHPGVAKCFDIEVIADHSTAVNYYRDALDHKGKDYWLPNQGDPDPVGGRP